MASYTRQSTFSDGDLITAALFNDEYNQLLAAFDNATGHKHDGTVGEGPVISVLGDAGLATPLNKILVDTTNDHIEFWIDVSGTSTQQLYIADGAIVPVTDNDIDLGTNSLQFKDLYINGTANIDNLAADVATLTTADINGGNIDGTVIGATTAAAGTFTTINASSNVVISGNLTVSGTTTSVNSNEVNIGDNIIVLNSDETGTPSQNAGIEIERGTSTNVSLLWNESNDYWTFGSNDLNFPDSSKAKFGDGNDLQIYHDGSNSYIKESGIGNLQIQATGSTFIKSSDGTKISAQFAPDSYTRLYHNNANKLETTSSGIDVTGTATMDGLTVEGDATIKGGSDVSNTGATLQLESTETQAAGSGASISFKGDDGSGTQRVFGVIKGSKTSANSGAFNGGLDFFTRVTAEANARKRLAIASNGDISFYENTGTTAKLFWDASAERLGLGTTSPAQLLHLSSSNPTIQFTDTDTGADSFIRANTSTGALKIEADENNEVANSAIQFDIDGSEKARIDYSGNLLVGTTNDFPPGDTGNEGVAIKPDNIAISRNNSTVLFLDRMTNDGVIVDLRKDNTSIGKLRSYSSDLIVQNAGTGLRFNDGNNTIHPVVSAGSVSDNLTDLGLSNARFKDLHLGGTANFGSLSDGTITITGFVDEDNMSSNSATLLPTQQSVKAYVDSQISSAGGNGISFEDNEKASFGTSTTLEIFSNNNQSNIKESGSGDLQIFGDNVNFFNASGTQNMVNMIDAGEVRIFHNGSQKFTTTSTGIDVTGNVVSDGIDLEENTSMYTQDATLSYYGSTNGVYLNGAGNDGWLRLNASGASNDANAINIFGANVGIGITFKTASTERARIDASGRLLIGQTSSNGDKLEIQGDANVYAARLNGSTTGGQSYGLRVRAGSNSSDAGLLVENTSGTDLLKVRGDGNVGIGTSSPGYLLSLSDSNGADLHFSNSSTLSDGDYLGRIYAADSTNNFFAGINMFYHDSNDGEIRFRIKTSGTNTDVMTLVDGRAGIGTTSPSHKLTVEGTTSHTTARVKTTTGNANLRVSTDNSDFAIIGQGGSNRLDVYDNNASATRLSLDSSGNLLVGKTSTSGSTAGISLKANGQLEPTVSGSYVSYFNRTSSDGAISHFAKDGTLVGSINSYASSRLSIGSNGASGVIFGTTDILPATSGTTPVNNTYNLGSSSYKFKDLRLGGKAYVGSMNVDAGNADGIKISSTAPYLFFNDTDSAHSYDSSISQSGTTLYVGGATPAQGIVFRNKASFGESARITTDGNLLIAKTSVGATNTVGHELKANGSTVHTVDGNPVMYINRKSTNGTLVEFRKDNTNVANIGTHAQDGQTNFFIGFNNASEDVGLGFGHASGTGRAYYPCRDDGSGVSSQISLGTSTYKYKDLHLSGNANLGSSNYLRFTAATSGSDASVLFGDSAGTSGSLTFKRNSDSATLAKINGTGQLLVTPLGVTTPSFAFTNDTNTGMTRPTSDTLQFVTAGSERVRITDTGNFGIGTSSPSTALTVVGDVTVSKTAAGSNILSLQRNGAANPWKLAQGHTATDYFEILEGNDARLTIKNGGSVGVNGGILNLGTADSSSGHINAYENMSFNIDVDNDDTNRYFSFHANGSDGSGSELMRITEAGNVGIGNSSPSSPLSVHSALPTGHPIAEFRSTGNVNATIDLRADGTGDPKIFFDLNGATPFAIGVDNSDSDKFKISGNYQLGTNDRFVIDSSGKVGIKNSSPSSQFFNTLVVGDTSGDNGITIQSSATGRGVLAFSDTDSATAGRYDGYISYKQKPTYI